VQILKNFEKIEGLFDWEVGKHGIEVNVEIEGEVKTQLALPEDIYDQEWNQESAGRLRILIFKVCSG
jgi:AMMECR1 domain-containing protein